MLDEGPLHMRFHISLGGRALPNIRAEYVAAVSHEMKTPLAGIKAYIEMLQDGDVEDDDTRRDMRKILDWLPSFPTIIGLSLLTTWLVDRKRENYPLAGGILVTLGLLLPVLTFKKTVLCHRP